MIVKYMWRTYKKQSVLEAKSLGVTITSIRIRYWSGYFLPGILPLYVHMDKYDEIEHI